MLLKPGDLVWANTPPRWADFWENQHSEGQGQVWKALEDAIYIGAAVAKFNDASPLPQLTPVTVLRTEHRSMVTIGWLQSTLEAIQQRSDFHPVFTTTLVFVSPPGPVTIEAAAESWMSAQNIVWRSFITPSRPLYKCVSGPYFAHKSQLWQAFKVFADRCGAFMMGLEPRKLRVQMPIEQEHGMLSITRQDYGRAVGIVVPSRPIQSSPQSCSLPLEGLRIAVKDVFRLKGMRASLYNHASDPFNTPALETAPIISVLTSAGAHIIGTTRLSSTKPYMVGEFPLPINPRADGFQSPAGSSQGSAVAVAAYDWVDLAVGTDTSGSGRRPALVNGIFQLRPTHNTLCVDGMVSTFEGWDTPCLYGRDLGKLRKVLSLWRSLKVSPPRYALAEKTSIVFPEDYFPVSNASQMSLVSKFVEDLSRTLGVKVARVSISSTWNRQPPPDANGESVEDYLRMAAFHGWWYDFYHSTVDFQDQSRGKFHAEPVLTQPNKYRWETGRDITTEQHQEALRRLTVYRQWFLRTIMKAEDYRCMLILPVADVEPNYIDTPSPEELPEGFDQLLLPPILGAPDVFVPLGESPYHSRVSRRQEYLPVGVDVVGTPGSDLWLIDEIQKCLRANKRPERVCTGPRMFPIA